MEITHTRPKGFATDSPPHTRHNALSWMVQRYSRFHTTGTPPNDFLHLIKLLVFKFNFIILQFRTINSDKRPCSDDMNYSYSKCVANCFTAEVNANGICRLPFINGNKNLHARHITILINLLIQFEFFIFWRRFFFKS
jgi:hypothetical protein